ncbi:zinc finger protein [Lentzea sp. NPDC042327]|uniref:zinc finger protein n=1 Tax=Lentzea sp. NPDC042327 TaxID=3154801 RepID=UPI0033D19305
MTLSSCTPPEPFRWFPYRGARHAVPRCFVLPGSRIESPCGEQLVVPEVEPPKYPDWLWPECPKCDSEWRKTTGRPQRSELCGSGCASDEQGLDMPKTKEQDDDDRSRNRRTQPRPRAVCDVVVG